MIHTSQHRSTLLSGTRAAPTEVAESTAPDFARTNAAGSGPGQILRPPAAADYIGLPVASLAKGRLYGWGPAFVRLGARAVGYRLADLDAWIESRVCRSTSDKSGS